MLAMVRQSNNVELSKTSRPTDRGVTVTVAEKDGRMMVLLPEGHSQHNSKGGGDSYNYYKVEITSTVYFLKQKKRIIMMWAVKHAQWSEVEEAPVEEVVLYAMGYSKDEAESGEGGQRGGATEEVPKSVPYSIIYQYYF